jgi:DNA polymerase III delta prime subunit
MDITVKERLAREIGVRKFVPFGISLEAWESWRQETVIQLGSLSKKELNAFEKLIKEHKHVRGTGVLLADIKTWRSIVEDEVGTQKARTVKQFAPVLTQYLLKAPGHRLYKRISDGAMLCYYVYGVEYHPPVQRDSGYYREPARVTMDMAYEKIGGKTSTSVTFHAEDCRNVPVAKALIDAGYQIETPELRQEYLDSLKRFLTLSGQVGKQFWAEGGAFVRGRDRWSRSSEKRTSLADEGSNASRVVMDVFYEDDDERRDARERRSVYMKEYFWTRAAGKSTYNEDEDTDEAEDEELELELVGQDAVEIPIHPWLIVFHLSKHERIRVHVDQLTEYEYDTTLAEKLILPKEQKGLISLLINTKGGVFEDIVAGKGGGAVVLLCGAPGTGKTLTAEIYAEAEERALYSVQCSQLGTEPDDLEEELLRCFSRAKRWDAVMLLDEADVYVHERGNDMMQNAVVGVFLRVLEYQATVLFLTTNRPDDVDDAIASRCIARINYKTPSTADAVRIWQVLAVNSSVKITLPVIKEIVAKNKNMTGRDIKNVLKLASLMTSGWLKPADVKYVQQFKPTLGGK